MASKIKLAPALPEPSLAKANKTNKDNRTNKDNKIQKRTNAETTVAKPQKISSKKQKALSRFGGGNIAQLAIVVYTIEDVAENWAALLGVPVPEIYVSLPEEQAGTHYLGEPTKGRARIAFFHLRQLILELIEPLDGPKYLARTIAHVRAGLTSCCH
ncbi:MAG: hypothetical protein ACRCYY_11915 [Trueperaceae bacterium]